MRIERNRMCCKKYFLERNKKFIEKQTNVSNLMCEYGMKVNQDSPEKKPGLS